MRNKYYIVALFGLFTLFLFIYRLMDDQNYEDIAIILKNFSQHTGNINVNDFTTHVVLSAKTILHYEPFIFFTMVNKPYVPFMKNWICNVIHMDSILSKTLIVTTDIEAFYELKNLKFQFAIKWYNEGEVNMSQSSNNAKDKYYSNSQIFKYVLIKTVQGYNIRLFTVIFYPLDIKLQNSLSYGNLPYLIYMNYRTHLIKELLNHKIPIFLFEADAYWSTNPLPNIFEDNVISNGPYTNLQYDIIGHKVSKTKLIGGGFLYLHPNNATIALWDRVHQEFSLYMNKTIEKSKPKKNSITKINSIIWPEINDQTILNKLLHDKLFTDEYKIKYKVLNSSLFTDGFWYKKKLTSTFVKPIIIQNNWIIGNENKIKRMKKYNQYFLGPNDVCQV